MPLSLDAKGVDGGGEWEGSIPLPSRLGDLAGPTASAAYAGTQFIDAERMKGQVGLPAADGLPTIEVIHQLQVKRRTGKFAGQRPTFYHCSMQPTNNRCVQSNLISQNKKF